MQGRRRRLLLVAALLSCCAGNSVHAQILSSVGETVILPCHITVRGDNPTVEWSKVGPEPTSPPIIAFLYRDGCETFQMKDQVFRYRTNLNMTGVKDGDFSLRMSDVRPSDAGRYHCLTRHMKNSHVAATLELVVCSAAEPKLSRCQVPGEGVTLQCEASGRSPQLQITFLDDRGNDIRAGNLTQNQDSRGCVTVARNVAVPTETSRVTCRVHQPPMNEPRDAHIYITVKNINNCIGTCTGTCSIAVFATFLFLSGLGVVIHYRNKKICVERGVSRETVVNIGELRLKCNRQGKEKTEEPKSRQSPISLSPPKSLSPIRHRSLGSSPKPVASPNNNNHDDLKSVNLPQSRVSGQKAALGRSLKRNFSSPALGAMSSGSSSASTSKEPHPAEFSVVTRNRFDVLSDVSEDSPLLPPQQAHLCTE